MVDWNYCSTYNYASDFICHVYLLVINMTIKQFMKPDWRKIVITVILLIFLIPLFILIEQPLGSPSGFPERRGFPFHYNVICMGGSIEENGMTQLIGLGYCFNWSYLLLDIFICILISYLLSCLIVWLYDKFRKKK